MEIFLSNDINEIRQHDTRSKYHLFKERLKLT